MAKLGHSKEQDKPLRVLVTEEQKAFFGGRADGVRFYGCDARRADKSGGEASADRRPLRIAAAVRKCYE